MTAQERLATTDELGNRVYTYPIKVKGKWSNIRFFFSWFLIFIYLVLPWIRIDGHQVILLNLAKREFHIFGTTFYGHDGPLLLFVLLGFVFSVTIITAIWGRVWCGYACPQTVFIEKIYRVIERLVEGSVARSRKLDQAPWNFTKVWKRALKWFLYLIVSLHIVHSGMGYFVGTHELLEISFQSPYQNLTLFISMLVLTAIILFDFGWFRDQFCIIACPYGRFQSIAMDESSLIIGYDAQRGEPRKRTKGVAVEDTGDCVNCGQCVKACPTGIDIRDGLQMECIACTACIDACDEIMVKVKKPKGLIRYTSEFELKGQKRKFSKRILVYLLFLITITSGFFYQLDSRDRLSIQVLRGKGETFTKIKDELILNHFVLKIHNYQHSTDKLTVSLNSYQIQNVELIFPGDFLFVNKDNNTVSIFFKFNPNILINGSKKIQIAFTEYESKKLILTKEVELVGPIK